MEFSFRLRLVLGGGVRIGCDLPELLLTDGSDEIVKLVGNRAVGGPQSKIVDSELLSLYGHGYQSSEQAQEAGTEWTGYLQAGFARLSIGADFGRRSPPMGRFTPYGLNTLSPQMGGRVLNDVHGLMVFESLPPPAGFVSMSVGRAVNNARSADGLRTAVAHARNERYDPDARERLAFDLYGASFFEFSPDARYMMLMMAIETLATQQARSRECEAHVEDLIEATRASRLEPKEIASMLGSLEHMKHESIIGAGKRLACERLAGRSYDGTPADQFFAKAYELRSTLAHGALDRPTYDEVERRAHELRVFVGDLLSGPLLYA